MDRGAWWARVHRLAKSDLTEVAQHAHRHMDLTFYILMQYSLYKIRLLLPPDTSTTEHRFCFDPASTSFLELFLCSSQVAYQTPTIWGEAHIPGSYLFAFSYCSWGSHSKNTGVVCHSLLQWTVLSELFTMTCLSWVAQHSLAHSFIELCKAPCHDKGVIHERIHITKMVIFKKIDNKCW